MNEMMWYYLSIVAVILSIIASVSVRSTFNKYSKIGTAGGRTAAQVAREILDGNGLRDVEIIPARGSLTDYYDPKRRVVALSDTVYNSASVSAIGVAAHECGHAVQYARDYAPIKARTAIFPVVSFCSRFWLIPLIGAMIFEMYELLWAAIILYAFVVLFQFITLPVELDASRRAMETIKSGNYLNGGEAAGARKVLTAAAFTYIAALMVSLVQLMRLLSRSRR